MKIKDGLIGHNSDIYYNSNGHRCKELSELNFRNYLLFAGDNLSLALDKDIEETYPSIISKALRMDYYNISIFNGGLDCTKHNLISWIYNKPKPKAIILGFEFLNAILQCRMGSDEFEYVDYENEIIKDVMNYANTSGFFWGRKKLFNTLLESINDIPIYQILLPNKQYLLDSKITNVSYNNEDFDHKLISNKIIDLLNFKYNTIKP